MKTVVIPDIHGRFDEFLSIVRGFTIIESGRIISSSVRFVTLGDYINRGSVSGQRKLLKFLNVNKKFFTLVLGNHEIGYYNKIHKIKNENFESGKHENSFYEAAKEDSRLKESFLKLYKSLEVVVECDDMQCCHSPCLEKHILGEAAETTRYKLPKKSGGDKEYGLALKDFFTEILDQNFEKLTIFGHMGFIKKPLYIGNQIWLDSINAKHLNYCTIENGRVEFYNSNHEAIKPHTNAKTAVDFVVKSYFDSRMK